MLCPVLQSETECAAAERKLLILDDPSADAAELRSRVREKRLLATAVDWRTWLARQTRVGAIFAAHFARPDSPQLRVAPGELQKWLGRVKDRYGDRSVSFVQIPERREVVRGEYDLDLGGEIRAAGFHYVSLLGECGFRREHYHRRDPHFDREGYELLLRCVGEALDLL